MTMAANYIIRLDDAHHRCDRAKWQRIESLLNKYGVKPLVAVIPDNRDLQISFSSQPDPDFWSVVRRWRAMGWSIAVHGLHHILAPAVAPVLPFAKHSEFCGKALSVQVEMLKESIRLFDAEGCTPGYFVAPAHGYDKNTMQALRKLSKELIVSDGFSFRPVQMDGVKYIPQQLWRPRAMLFGLWTICLHPCTMTEGEFAAMAEFLDKNKKYLISVENVKAFPGKTISDRLFENFLFFLLALKGRVVERVK
jgi:hypothetical protein